MSRIVRALYALDRAKRVLIIEREDGHYGLQVETRYRNEYEGRLVGEGWRRLPHAPSVFHTIDIAEREARSRIPMARASATINDDKHFDE